MTHKILVLGSIASGKTTLSRRLASVYLLPIIHVDELEFNSDLTKKPIEEIRVALTKAVSGSAWILDGFGPLDRLPVHIKMATVIVFIDSPFYLNLLWLVKRQFQNARQPRKELPADANEWRWSHFKKMVEALFKQHRLMNPELRKILQRTENKSRVYIVKSKSDLDRLLDDPARFLDIANRG